MKKTIFSILPVLLGLLTAPASAQESITTPILSSLNNFRDIAGPLQTRGGTGIAYTTRDGGVMRTGVLYRSNALAPNDADKETLTKLGIKTVIDMRKPKEVEKAPDWVPPGAKFVHIDVLGGVDEPNPGKDRIEQMENAERIYVNDRIPGFRAVLLELSKSEGPALIHCTWGKDRTGWTTALLQTIAGMSPEDIMKDYLATNQYSPDHTVNASFLQAGLDEATKKYGSMTDYIHHGMGLSEADIQALRAKLVYYKTAP